MEVIGPGNLVVGDWGGHISEYANGSWSEAPCFVHTPVLAIFVVDGVLFGVGSNGNACARTAAGVWSFIDRYSYVRPEYMRSGWLDPAGRWWHVGESREVLRGDDVVYEATEWLNEVDVDPAGLIVAVGASGYVVTAPFEQVGGTAD